jgi:serine/threonine protein kinase
MLKLLDEDSFELDILRHLNSIELPANHVIHLLEWFHLDVGTIVALPIASPLDCLGFTTPTVGLSLMHQLIEAVSFIQANSVVHLDLKPSNVLVSMVDNCPRLVVIDFGASIFVASPDAQIEGFVGTPGWVAPEVGTKHGRPQRYSPIHADLWACRWLLDHIAEESKVRDSSIIQLAAGLSSDDPLQRPLLKADPPHYSGEGGPKRLPRHRGVSFRTNVSNQQAVQ